MHTLPEVVRLCHNLFFDVLSKPQRENLGRSVVALSQSGSAGLSALARTFHGAQKFRYRLKRLDRFIGNHRVRITRCLPVLAPTVVHFADRMSGYVPIILDHTDVGTIRICYAAVLFKQRALPLLFVPFWKHTIKVSQNRIEKDLLGELKALLPVRLRVVIVADRGFGRVSLFRFIKLKLRWDYVIRAKSDVWITSGQENDTLRRLPLTFWREGVRYQQKVQYVVNIATCWRDDTDDPWFLVTSLDHPVLVQHIYERRMRIEELFRDEKWHLGLEVPTARQLGRFSRLLFITLLATLILLLLGAKAQRYATLTAAVITTTADAGLLWLAVQLLQHGPPGRMRALLRQVTRQMGCG